jgi:hypothetical protein
MALRIDFTNMMGDVVDGGFRDRLDLCRAAFARRMLDFATPRRGRVGVSVLPTDDALPAVARLRGENARMFDDVITPGSAARRSDVALHGAAEASLERAR